MSENNGSDRKFQNGAVDWVGFGGGGSEKKTNAKDLFLRLQPGSNIVRLLTVPYQYHQHKKVFDNDTKGKYGRRINCAGAGCPVCAMGDKAKRRWLVGVIDRRSGMYKILDIGFAIFKGIQLLAQDSDWGNPEDYDCDISAHPENPATNYYGVVAKPKKPMSAADLAIKDAIDFSELERRTTAPTPEQVQDRIDKIMAEINGTAGNSASLTEAVGSSSGDEDDDDDAFFPAYDKKSKTA